jgi:hypothetical protein
MIATESLSAPTDSGVTSHLSSRPANLMGAMFSRLAILTGIVLSLSMRQHGAGCCAVGEFQRDIKVLSGSSRMLSTTLSDSQFQLEGYYKLTVMGNANPKWSF